MIRFSLFLFLLTLLSGSWAVSSVIIEPSDSVTPSSWLLLIEATAGGFHDSLAMLGVKSDATSGYDPLYDLPHPPSPPGNYVEVYFPHSGGNWPTFIGSRYATDYVGPANPSWLFIVETTAGNGTVALTWDTIAINQLPPVYEITLKDTVIDVSVNMRAQNSYSFPYTDPRVFTVKTSFAANAVGMDARWNLISVPRVVEDLRKDSLFPSSISDAYGFTTSYSVCPELENGTGYWLKFESDTTIIIRGEPMPSVTIPVREGWNIIGSPDHEVPAPAGGIVMSNIFGYHGGYRIDSVIRPGKGYWVKVASDGVLQLGDVPGMMSAKPPAIAHDIPLRLTIRDQQGGEQVLFLIDDKSSGVQADRYDLPPPPPSPVFDARFSSNRYAEVIRRGDRDSARFIIKIQSDDFPVELLPEVQDRGTAFSLTVLTQGWISEHKPIVDGSPVVLEGPDQSQIVLIVEGGRERLGVPYRIDNYPNPFNTSTLIVYTLPERAHVRLGVYDLCGGEVTLLVDEVRDRGHAVLTFDADQLGLASGMYILHLRVEGSGVTLLHTAVKKIMYLK